MLNHPRFHVITIEGYGIKASQERGLARGCLPYKSCRGAALLLLVLAACQHPPELRAPVPVISPKQQQAASGQITAPPGAPAPEKTAPVAAEPDTTQPEAAPQQAPSRRTAEARGIGTSPAVSLMKKPVTSQEKVIVPRTEQPTPPLPAEPEPADRLEAQTGAAAENRLPPASPAGEELPEDMVGNLIASLTSPRPQQDVFEEQRDPGLLLAPMQPVPPSAAREGEPVAPPAADQENTAALAEQAIEAALALLADKSPRDSLESDFQLPAKPAGNLRVGLLLPFSGEWAGLGGQIAAGAELALFQSGKQGLELVYLDTAGGPRAALAAREAVSAQTDILIGPLFTASAEAMDSSGMPARLPALSLSNNQQVARPGRWVMGYLPEQQLDMLLGHAISTGKQRIAILSATDAFGTKLRDHALQRLQEMGIGLADLRLLEKDILDDQQALADEVRAFARYSPPAAGQLELPPPAFDAILLTGGEDFVLRTAPMLAYYDLGPDRVLYLGTDLWARDSLRDEPSLQGSVIALPALPDDSRLQKIWQNSFAEPAESLAKTGFDAMAMIAAFADADSKPQDIVGWSRKLTRQKGFNGFSGPFRLLPEGINQRRYALHQLQDGELTELPDRLGQ